MEYFNKRLAPLLQIDYTIVRKRERAQGHAVRERQKQNDAARKRKEDVECSELEC